MTTLNSGGMYLAAHNSRRRVLALPVPGSTVAALKSGSNLVPGKPSREDRLRRALGANSMTFLCLFGASP